jgi:hypothetical protein
MAELLATKNMHIERAVDDIIDTVATLVTPL